jgi:hypothetical protein
MQSTDQMTRSGVAAELYLDLLKKCLSRYIFGEQYRPLTGRNRIARAAVGAVHGVLRPAGFELVRHSQFDSAMRAAGIDIPADAETMIGLSRLNHLQDCVTEVISEGVPGDLIETGVWRGGACILMRAVLKAYGETGRTVWLADSFEGLPEPNRTRYPAETDEGLVRGLFSAGLEQVQENFRRYGLLDSQVRFLPGWFRDTLPHAPFSRLALMRLDGDLYESTMDALVNLYPRLSVGGYVIIDDYFLACCRAAVDDFRARENVRETLLRTEDNMGAYWKRVR